MHTGEQYHQFILSSPSDQSVREEFQALVLEGLPAGADILDFGAGTGIDAKVYVARGHRVFVHEPSEAMRAHLAVHCSEEIASGRIITVTRPLTCKVHAVTANFAVLDHFSDHTALFDELSRVVTPGGFVLASMLNPYYAGDARYGWWWANVMNLLRRGRYAIASESGVHRFAPGVVARAAVPHFTLERFVPRGLGCALRPFMFLLFRRI
jgi:SAM-dependent methyltransferase